MAVDSAKSRPERRQTDESLRVERQKTDRALADRQAVEDDADLVVQRARENADAVLNTARAKADKRLDEPAPQVVSRTAIAKERQIEDVTLQGERAAADESLRREREESARALAKLLPLEREKTDRYLLTERARADHDLSNRDDFMAIVSHDLRNLLSGIALSSALLSEGAPATEEGKRLLDGTQRIQRYVARMNRLIGDLVDVASIDAGKLAVTLTLADSASLIAEAVDMFHAAAAAKGVSLEMELAERPLPAELDHERILQVLANLITNGIKFSSPGGRIRVRGERAGDELRFSVEDTGSGIPSTMLEAIFERFWQVGENDRRGLGLGLYISKCIVEVHGGRIWAESTLGEGSSFRFTLPARAARGPGAS